MRLRNLRNSLLHGLMLSFFASGALATPQDAADKEPRPLKQAIEKDKATAPAEAKKEEKIEAEKEEWRTEELEKAGREARKKERTK